MASLNKFYSAILGATPVSFLLVVNLLKNVTRYHSLSVSPKSVLANTILGKNVTIGGGIYLTDSVIGDRTYFAGSEFGGIQSYIGSAIIGKYCSIAQNLQVLDGGHDCKFISTYPFYTHPNFPLYNVKNKRGKIVKKTVIGNDVWIGANVIIIGGRVIGDGAVIGAGSVITKDVQPYEVVAGNPARSIKFRFEKKTIKELLKMKWWDWEEEKIITNAHLLTDKHILNLLKKA